MKFHIILFFVVFSLFLLFYPGDSQPLHTFAYNRRLFTTQAPPVPISLDPIPVATGSALPVITAESAYLTDRKTLSPIYSLNEKVRMFPASTTKLITALVAFDLYKPDEVVEIHKTIADGQVMGLVVGEKITFENLLYGLLVYSGNDAAFALANEKGYDQFIQKMNEKAQALHMNNSHFVNPHGLHNPEQYTTAYDLTLAARAVLDNPYLAKIGSTKEITISDVDFKYFHRLANVNQLLGVIPGIGGLKTGYTEEAGQNLVTLYKRHDGNEIIIVVLHSLDRFTDTANLVYWNEGNIGYVSPKL
ncbi:D-alanyl-D-alanine carboxypeptidase [Candidatus Microgenomates bacterium]|nr:D-alanyl-D-alanine carboxypeptidase [Candidatus Microgenomates bacterium]